MRVLTIALFALFPDHPTPLMRRRIQWPHPVKAVRAAIRLRCDGHVGAPVSDAAAVMPSVARTPLPCAVRALWRRPPIQLLQRGTSAGSRYSRQCRPIMHSCGGGASAFEFSYKNSAAAIFLEFLLTSGDFRGKCARPRLGPLRFYRISLPFKNRAREGRAQDAVAAPPAR